MKQGLAQPAGCRCPRLSCFLGPSGAAVAVAVAGAAGCGCDCCYSRTALFYSYSYGLMGLSESI